MTKYSATIYFPMLREIKVLEPLSTRSLASLIWRRRRHIQRAENQFRALYCSRNSYYDLWFMRLLDVSSEHLSRHVVDESFSWMTHLGSRLAQRFFLINNLIWWWERTRDTTNNIISCPLGRAKLKKPQQKSWISWNRFSKILSFSRESLSNWTQQRQRKIIFKYISFFYIPSNTDRRESLLMF